jgi:hypothetical protein
MFESITGTPTAKPSKTVLGNPSEREDEKNNLKQLGNLAHY